MAMCFLLNSTQAQFTTYFYGRDKIQSQNQTAALYSVTIYPAQTWVTVELIPTTTTLSRLNYWTSRNTYIVMGGGEIELPILGFLRTENGEEFIDERPFDGNWGWNDPIMGQKYHYTMIFDGTIPPGVTNFTLKDKGVNGYHGYGFGNYQLNNPRIGGTSWTEWRVKQNAIKNNDGICGIYEGSDETGYKLGCVKENGTYRLIYLGSKKWMSWWQVGDIKATLRPSATLGLFKANWYMADKSLNSDYYVVFDGMSMQVFGGGDDKVFYLKMYPTSSGQGNFSSKNGKWSGTGFALNGKYVITNYHVIEGARSILIQGIKGNFDLKYKAVVVATDRHNDLALLWIDSKWFNGFEGIPYSIKTSISDVGEDVFVLGYPMTNTMGTEIKLTTGVISAKTGFQGDVSLYQISAPIQPGNSGGPLFDRKGNVIGIVNAKHSRAENVSYAIKTSYLKNLIENSGSSWVLPKNNKIANLTLAQKVRSLKNFVFLITCSN